MPRTKKKSGCSKELHRQKDILFKRLKKIHRECDVSTMTFMITAKGVVHVHASPELTSKYKECMKPLVDIILQRRQLSKSHHHHDHDTTITTTEPSPTTTSSSSSPSSLVAYKISDGQHAMVETMAS